MFGALGGGVALRPALPARGTVTVTHWSPGGVVAPGPGKWVMVGGRTWRNYLFSGMSSKYSLGEARTTIAPASSLHYPEGWEAVKGLFGQRIWK